MLESSTSLELRRYTLTHGPGVLQRVGREYGLCSLGRPSCSGLVHGPDPEAVQRPLLEPIYREVARFLHVHVAAHPLALSDIAPERRKRSKLRETVKRR